LQSSREGCRWNLEWGQAVEPGCLETLEGPRDLAKVLVVRLEDHERPRGGLQALAGDARVPRAART
jgi:hypothetical protein